MIHVLAHANRFGVHPANRRRFHAARCRASPGVNINRSLHRATCLGGDSMHIFRRGGPSWRQ
jgi:hypothetical protein